MSRRWCLGPMIDTCYVQTPCGTACGHRNGDLYTQLKNVTFTLNPIASLSIPNFPNIHNAHSVLSVYSHNDAQFETYVFEVQGEHDSYEHVEQYRGNVILYAFLAVSVTNLCSLTGISCIPLKRWRHFNYLLNFMVGLAVSALFSTALLVLIPEALRLEEIPLEFGGQGQRFLIFCNVRKSSEVLDSDLELMDITTDISLIDSTVEALPKKLCCGKCSLSNFMQVAPVAWMILLGDSVHNFMDGVAIATGFVESPSIGLTLALCVLLEELPHELGDFVVLISTGLSIRCILFINFLSACAAYLGMVIGLLIGEATSGGFYVFAAMTGVFLYISLADMLPSLRETLEKIEKRNRCSSGLFMVQFAGLLVGCACVSGALVG
ncbi:hypothetical protein ACTXT7_012091, partial [Hymenolepis weldensis]